MAMISWECKVTELRNLSVRSPFVRLIIYLIQPQKQVFLLTYSAGRVFWNGTLDKPSFRCRRLRIPNLQNAHSRGQNLFSNLMLTWLQGPGFHSGHSPRLHLAMLCGLLLLSHRALPPSHCTVRLLKPSPQVFEHCKQTKTHENVFANAQKYVWPTNWFK